MSYCRASDVSVKPLSSARLRLGRRRACDLLRAHRSLRSCQRRRGTPGEERRGVRRVDGEACPLQVVGFLWCEGAGQPIDGGHHDRRHLKKITTDARYTLATLLDEGHSDRDALPGRWPVSKYSFHLCLITLMPDGNARRSFSLAHDGSLHAQGKGHRDSRANRRSPQHGRDRR